MCTCNWVQPFTLLPKENESGTASCVRRRYMLLAIGTYNTCWDRQILFFIHQEIVCVCVGGGGG